MFGLALQDLLNQVIHDVPVVSRESPNKLMNILSTPIDSDASWSPAIQPSVRVSSKVTSSAERLRPIT